MIKQSLDVHSTNLFPLLLCLHLGVYLLGACIRPHATLVAPLLACNNEQQDVKWHHTDLCTHCRREQRVSDETGRFMNILWDFFWWFNTAQITDMYVRKPRTLLVLQRWRTTACCREAANSRLTYVQKLTSAKFSRFILTSSGHFDKRSLYYKLSDKEILTQNISV